jgi:hypothetical protein
MLNGTVLPGSFWCTLKTLEQLLIRIELEAAGVPISFVHRAQKFSYEVEFDDGTATAAKSRSRSRYSSEPSAVLTDVADVRLRVTVVVLHKCCK